MKSPENQPTGSSMARPVSWLNLSRLLKKLRRKKISPAQKQQELQERLKIKLLPPSFEGFPPSSFRLLSAEQRACGNYLEAQRIAGIGVAIHPLDRWLAMEHAQAASGSGDLQKIAAYWERVTEIGSPDDPPPVKAFLKWTEALVNQGKLEEADETVTGARKLHPSDASLLELSGKIHMALGRTAIAINIWKSLLAEHPDHNPEATHLRMYQSYMAEGMLSHGRAILEKGLLMVPGSEKLLKISRDLETRRPRNSASWKISVTDPLDGERAISLPAECGKLNEQLSRFLGFSRHVPQPRDETRAHEADTFAVWQDADSHLDRISIKHAAKSEKPLLFLDESPVFSAGFNQSRGIERSIIFSPESSYKNSICASYFEKTLNADSYRISDSERLHSFQEIEAIRSNREKSATHFLPPIPNKGINAKRILLIDQAASDPSLAMGMSGKLAFMRMLQFARSLDGYDLWILRETVPNSNPRFILSSLLSANTSQHIHLIEPHLTPYQLFPFVDKVLVGTSNIGFDALMAGKEVHCFGVPYYSGWGLTTDHLIVPRRRKRRTVEEIFHLLHIKQTIHLTGGKGIQAEHFQELEDVSLFTPPTETQEESTIPTAPEATQPRILIIIPSGRFGASGRYLQTLARSLQYHGCPVMILAEGGQARMENGIKWLPIAFDGSSLATHVRERVNEFGPNIIYENGVRSRAQRAALELVIMTGARLAMQSEDDDVQIHTSQYGEHMGRNLADIDTPEITTQRVNDYIQNKIDLHHSLDIFLEPSLDRWIEPVSRALCYRLASVHTAIWHPFADRLSTQYRVPTLVVPPVASRADFERIPFSEDERSEVLKGYGIDPESTVIFIGGALYSYSPEFSLFLDALNIVEEQGGPSISLVLTGTRTSMPVARMGRERLLPKIGFHILHLTSDDHYMEMLKACDVICSPGYPDTFNRYRLPSRLVKGMAMGKPILTSVFGFGESLEHGFNGFLMDGTDPHNWADSIAPVLNPNERKKIGENGRKFAMEHFDSDRVAKQLKRVFEKALSMPVRKLRDTVFPDHKRSEQKSESASRCRDRYASTMQDAIACIEAGGEPVDTVIHVGAGAGGELEDYIRLAAKRLLLVEPLSCHVDHLRNLAGNSDRMEVIPLLVSSEPGLASGYITGPKEGLPSGGEEFHLSYPGEFLQKLRSFEIKNEEQFQATSMKEICRDVVDPEGNHVLILELNGNEEKILRDSSLILGSFRWVALRIILPVGSIGAAKVEDVSKFFATIGFKFVAPRENHVDIGTILVFHRR